MRKRGPLVLAVVISVASVSVALAKVAIIPLAEVVDRAEFIGIVRVERISGGIPLVKKRRATASILQSWKGQSQGSVTFVASPAWTCDIADAKVGEEAVVFVSAGSLEHSGRGRMPIFVREGRRLAAVWNDVRLPDGLATEAGPEPQYEFIRGVGVEALRDAVGALSQKAARR